MKSELLRKALHTISIMLIFLLLNIFSTWYEAVIAVVGFVVVVYPVLALLERFPLYGKFFSERKSGEVKMSLIIISLMAVLLISVFWGWLGTGWKYIIFAAVMAWGFGDAAAALVGKAYGRHPIEHRLVGGKKTVEGTLAMYTVSGLAIFITTIVYTAAPWYMCLSLALLVAPACAVVELLSHHGVDTITVPISAAVLIFTFVSLSTFLGV